MSCQFRPYRGILLFLLASVLAGDESYEHAARADEPAAKLPEFHVKKTGDFEVTGRGDNEAWEKAAWVDLKQRPSGTHNYKARFKMLFSATGLYFLMDGTDSKLTATFQKDFENLWTEDVFEIFLWTDERHPVYFEYEISPLGYELPILIPNFGGEFFGWRPWHYEGKERKTRKAVHISGGEQKSDSAISGWRAEIFIPYDLLKPLQNVPPKAGTRWRGNFYRVDHDGGESTAWDWARVGPSFHEYQKFGTIHFD